MCVRCVNALLLVGSVDHVEDAGAKVFTGDWLIPGPVRHSERYEKAVKF
jgi:hypothetical protein